MTTATSLTAVQLVQLREYLGYPPKRQDGGHILFGALWNADGELEYALSQFTPEENGMIIDYLTDLKALKAGSMGAMDNVSTAQAAVWVRNPNEIAEWEAAYTRRRLALCAAIGVRPGPFLQAGGATHWVQ